MKRVFVPTSNAGKLREFEHALSLQGLGCLGINAAAQECGDAFSWKTPDEDRETFTGNNCKKLFAGLKVLPVLGEYGVDSVVVDDSGLCVPRLNFLPGVHSATFGGLPRDDAKNRHALIAALGKELGIKGSELEPGFFVCSLLMAGEAELVHGRVGKVVSEDDLIPHLEEIESQIMARVKNRLVQTKSMAYGYKSTIAYAGKKYQLQLVMGFCVGRIGSFEQQLLEGEGHGYDSMFFPNAVPHLSFASIPLHEKNQMSHRSEALRGLSAMAQSHTAQDGILELF
ncbi:MAG: non-canonical purine NTP pyrophosphatase [Betaproteobacteria bacterium]|nr:non-canonical purine NTP pyrophosphatase [Betaproteobacteria bacterium]